MEKLCTVTVTIKIQTQCNLRDSCKITALNSILYDGKGKAMLDSVDMKMKVGKTLAAKSVRSFSLMHSI